VKKTLLAILLCICTAPAMAQFYDVVAPEEAFAGAISKNGSVTVPRGYGMPIREYQVDPITQDVVWERQYFVDNRDPAVSCNGDACTGPTCGNTNGLPICVIDVMCPDGVTHYTVSGECLFKFFGNPGLPITCGMWSCVCELQFSDIPVCPPGTPPGTPGPQALLEIQRCVSDAEGMEEIEECATSWSDCPLCLN
jgi:hypothetical protein